MTVHFGGVSCDMQPILAIAQRHSLAVIEDVSHAHGGAWNHRGLGSIAMPAASAAAAARTSRPAAAAS